ncbi:MAG: helix-turn-helix transcriptional regulator [Lentisphaerae bacterium]|nr:helix-turn-helix transcriptional regulator [Lentisphaerota bacterium]
MSTRSIEARRARRMTAPELARRIPGLTEARLRRIEHGRLSPTVQEAAAIEYELAAPAGSLFPPETITPRKWSHKR